MTGLSLLKRSNCRLGRRLSRVSIVFRIKKKYLFLKKKSEWLKQTDYTGLKALFSVCFKKVDDSAGYVAAVPCCAAFVVAVV